MLTPTDHRKKIDLLQVEHYAVIITETTQHYVPGDERSRTHPGHGYPEGYETRTTIKYEAFETVEEVANWVKWKGDRTPNYRIIKAIPLKAETEVKVSIK